MIELNRLTTPASGLDIKIKIIGIGGAGSNVLDRLVLDGVGDADIVAMNTDVQSLTGSVARDKVQLGRNATRGLGAGGDPEIGLAAAEEAVEEIRGALEGSTMIFLCVGLGGGTGSGAAALIAQTAKERGALAVVFATLPFSFEGKRRRRQAEDALAALQEAADVVICFENDRMGEAMSPKAGIHQAFVNADQTISQSVKAVCGLLRRTGLIHLGFDDLATALRNNDARCLFGFGEGDGDNRAHDALALALKNPLMDRGRMLADAANVLVSIAGGQDMTLNEVQVLMEELNRHIGDNAQILFGAAVDAKMGSRMSVSIISSVVAGGSPPIARERTRPAPATVTAPEAEEEEPEQASFGMEEEEPVEEPALQPRIPAAVSKGTSPAVTGPLPSKTPVERQASLSFEPATRGRFEKSEPTIIDGEDLDVPTFLRRHIKVK